MTKLNSVAAMIEHHARLECTKCNCFFLIFFSFLFLSTRTGQASKSDYSRNAVSWVENGEDIKG